MILTSYVGVTGFESRPGYWTLLLLLLLLLITYVLPYLLTYLLTAIITYLLLTSIEFSLGGHSPHTSTDKPNNKYT